MNAFLQALNHPADAFHNNHKKTAWLLTAIAVLVNSLLDPLLCLALVDRHPAVDVLRVVRTTFFGCVSYALLCAVFLLVGKALGSKTTFATHLNTWGLTFFPNILCSVAVVLTEIYFWVFWDSLWASLLAVVFVGILIWKALLYWIYLREVMGLQKGRRAAAFFLIGLAIALLAFLNAYAGIKTPIL